MAQLAYRKLPDGSFESDCGRFSISVDARFFTICPGRRSRRAKRWLLIDRLNCLEKTCESLQDAKEYAEELANDASEANVS